MDEGHVAHLGRPLIDPGLTTTLGPSRPSPAEPERRNDLGGLQPHYGGNCCEHYLATTTAGAMLIGGEYPVSGGPRSRLGRGPSVPDRYRTFVPTNPGTEGLVKAPSCRRPTATSSRCRFPYVGGDLKLDKFYAILYDDSEMSWRWCYNRITEPFYDRSWQVEVIGPIDSTLSGEWASW